MHDRDGKPLAVGDTVTIAFVITDTSATEDYCNVQLQTVEPMFPSNRFDKYWFNAKQTVKVE
jgi:hypothetical protein